MAKEAHFSSRLNKISMGIRDQKSISSLEDNSRGACLLATLLTLQFNWFCLLHINNREQRNLWRLICHDEKISSGCGIAIPLCNRYKYCSKKTTTSQQGKEKQRSAHGSNISS